MVAVVEVGEVAEVPAAAAATIDTILLNLLSYLRNSFFPSSSSSQEPLLSTVVVDLHVVTVPVLWSLNLDAHAPPAHIALTRPDIAILVLPAAVVGVDPLGIIHQLLSLTPIVLIVDAHTIHLVILGRRGPVLLDPALLVHPITPRAHTIPVVILGHQDLVPLGRLAHHTILAPRAVIIVALALRRISPILGPVLAHLAGHTDRERNVRTIARRSPRLPDHTEEPIHTTALRGPHLADHTEEEPRVHTTALRGLARLPWIETNQIVPDIEHEQEPAVHVPRVQVVLHPVPYGAILPNQVVPTLSGLTPVLLPLLQHFVMNIVPVAGLTDQSRQSRCHPNQNMSRGTSTAADDPSRRDMTTGVTWCTLLTAQCTMHGADRSLHLRARALDRRMNPVFLGSLHERDQSLWNTIGQDRRTNLAFLDYLRDGRLEYPRKNTIGQDRRTNLAFLDYLRDGRLEYPRKNTMAAFQSPFHPPNVHHLTQDSMNALRYQLSFLLVQHHAMTIVCQRPLQFRNMEFPRPPNQYMETKECRGLLLRKANAEREQLERLTEVENRLQEVAGHAQEAEDQRERDFRNSEEERARIFMEGEERRDQEAREARERQEAPWRDAEGLGPPPPHSPTRPPTIHTDVGGDGASIRSVRASEEAASRMAASIKDTIDEERAQMERERAEMAAERAKLEAERDAARDALMAEKEARVKALEEELATLRGELDNEKQLRATEDAEARERERQALSDNAETRTQLGDITNLIQDQREACERKKELMEERWNEKQERRQNKEFKWVELRDMVQKIHDDMEADRARAEDARLAEEGKPGIEKVIEELTRQNAEQRELLTALSDTWRADCTRQHQETIDAVRSTAREQVDFNVQGYLDEFSKALATEVRMLLGEVGKLREERRALQHELGYLLCMKSKYGPGGEFEPEWKPPPGAPGGPPLDPGPPPPPPDLPQAKPGWRTVHQRATATQRKTKKKDAAPPPPPPPGPDPRHRSWATWQPDPNLAPTPPSHEPTLLVPDVASPGLFGPRSPSSSRYGGH
ncbi:hypothetical protein MSAN_00926200 [Mycena sanguinolenta]|uniref:Uncharacterized protein n=1 Tax=Mycena sanguinolenta TaxID=230812 RepID=A0A8H6YYM4_9AGAR|nr:hypothetical protein MSAN_00926200 [Mycena sanguinolenta]